MKYGALSFVALLALTSCDAPGHRAAETAAIRPSEVADFRVLYSRELLRLPWQRMDREP